MAIDKQKLQPLLWSVVASWRAGSDALDRHTDALDEFLGETTVEEVALGLLDEINQLTARAHAAEKQLQEVANV